MHSVGRLTPESIARFRLWLESGAMGSAPAHLLFGTGTEPLDDVASVELRSFASRLELGEYLAERLKPLPASQLRFDAGIWDWLSLFYIDALAPRSANGDRDIKQIYRYTLELKNRLWSRHILRMSWMTVIDHGSAARVMLALPITKQSEVMEQLAGQQEVFGARPVIEAADRLYWDQQSGALKRGAQGKAGGTPRRLVRYMRQFRRTYDPPTMTVEQLLASLPQEFERWTEAWCGSVCVKPQTAPYTYEVPKDGPKLPCVVL
jgi:hypothetical protein